jgi:hypothetical protein
MAGSSQDVDAASFKADLTSLIMECPELAQLEARLAQFNIFRILKADRHEIRHSNMLAWLLNPIESHGLEDLFLRRWIMEIMYKADQDNVTEADRVSPISIDVLQIENVEVYRERDSIDVLVIVSTKNGDEWVFCIENKVGAKQSKDQLKKYRIRVEEKFSTALHRFYIFLTKNTEEPADKRYLVSSYSDIARVLDRCISEQRDSIGPEPLLLIEHYQQLLREDFMDENESTRLAREIYKRHARAIDFIIENKIDPVFNLTTSLENAIANSSEALGVVMSRSGKGRIRFLPKEWDRVENQVAPGRDSAGHFLVLLLDLYGKNVDFSIMAERAPANWTDHVWDLCAHPPFQKSQKLKPEKWLKAYTAKSSFKVTDESDVDTLSQEIFEWLTSEMKKPQFVEAKDKLLAILPHLKAG